MILTSELTVAYLMLLILLSRIWSAKLTMIILSRQNTLLIDFRLAISLMQTSNLETEESSYFNT